MHSAQQILFEDANFLVDIDIGAKTLLSIGNTTHYAPGAWCKWYKWCIVNCTLFDFSNLHYVKTNLTTQCVTC